MDADKEKAAKKAANKKYYEKNRENELQRKKEYRDANKEKLAEYAQLRRDVLGDELKEKNKEYREVNKETIVLYKKKYYESNKERLKESIDCECGGTYKVTNKSHHLETQRHQAFQIGRFSAVSDMT